MRELFERLSEEMKKTPLLYVLILIFVMSISFVTINGIGAQTPIVGNAATIPKNIQNSEGTVHLIAKFDSLPNIERRNLLNQQYGIKFLNYVADKGYLVSLPKNTVQLITSSNNRISLVPILPEEKISKNLLNNEIAPWGIEEDTIYLSIKLFQDVNLEDSVSLFSDSAEIVSTIEHFNFVTIKISSKNLKLDLLKIAHDDRVEWISQVSPPLALMNDGSRAVINVDQVQASPLGLSGLGVNVLLYEWYPDDHIDLVGRVFNSDPDFPPGSITPIDHTTHVAGTLGGDGSLSSGLYRGMAPSVRIFSYVYELIRGSVCGNPFPFPPSPIPPPSCWIDPVDMYQDYLDGIIVHNIDITSNSIGQPLSGGVYSGSTPAYVCDWEGDYVAESIVVDSFVHGDLGKAINSIWAAGNEGGYIFPLGCGPYYTLSGSASGKNSIAVGAVNSDTKLIASFSSVGPTSDGRIKPDIVAGGCQVGGDQGITSTISSPYPTGVDRYWSECGTSQATPAVSGSIALLLEGWRRTHTVDPLPSTLKAVLIHTAKDIESPGPDFKSGYGLIDVQAAANKLLLATSRGFVIENSVDQRNSYVQSFTIGYIPNNNITVTLVWDDYVGTLLSNKTLVNDLDLTLESPNGTIYRPFVLNPYSPASLATTGVDHTNNVEKIIKRFPIQRGVWKVHVKGSSVPLGPQKFSLILSY